MQILYEASDIAKRVNRLASDIVVDYWKKDLVVLSVLKGAFVFTSDLLRAMHKPNVSVEFVRVRSYEGTLSTGQISIEGLDLMSLHDKNVLVCDDILDTGRTCIELRNRILLAAPQSLKFCVLLDKPSRRLVDFVPNYTGFTISNKFVIGYGLDYNGRYRNLTDIYTFKEEDNGSLVG